MPTTQPDRIPARQPRMPRISGFTFVELLVAMVIGGFTLAGVLTVFLMIGKVQSNALSYVEMERDAQRSLERFSEDARMASKVITTPTVYVTGVDITDVHLTVPRAYTSVTDDVEYKYDSANKWLLRIGPDPVTGAANTTTILARNVEKCVFKPWKTASLGAASTNNETDLLQIQLTMKKTRNTTVATTDLVVSASYLIRNHPKGS